MGLSGIAQWPLGDTPEAASLGCNRTEGEGQDLPWRCLLPDPPLGMMLGHWLREQLPD